MMKKFISALLSGALRLIVVSPLLMSQLACTDQKVELRLTSYELNRIDTLYARQAEALRDEADSLCNAAYPKLVQTAVDSIISERIATEERLRRRIPIRQ
jgi:hypothetical protein